MKNPVPAVLLCLCTLCLLCGCGRKTADTGLKSYETIIHTEPAQAVDYAQFMEKVAAEAQTDAPFLYTPLPEKVQQWTVGDARTDGTQYTVDFYDSRKRHICLTVYMNQRYADLAEAAQSVPEIDLSDESVRAAALEDGYYIREGEQNEVYALTQSDGTLLRVQVTPTDNADPVKREELIGYYVLLDI